MVPANALPAVGAKFCSGFAATLFMLFQFLRASESTDVADLNFLAGLERCGSSIDRGDRRFETPWKSNPRFASSARLVLCSVLRFGVSLGSLGLLRFQVGHYFYDTWAGQILSLTHPLKMW